MKNLCVPPRIFFCVTVSTVVLLFVLGLPANAYPNALSLGDLPHQAPNESLSTGGLKLTTSPGWKSVDPVWLGSKTFDEAKRRFSDGHWTDGVEPEDFRHFEREERVELAFIDSLRRTTPIGQLSNVTHFWDAFDQPRHSLYNTTLLPNGYAHSFIMCRLAVGMHSCGLEKGQAYHGRRWSNNAGFDFFDFVGRLNLGDPKVLLVGDSTVGELYWAILCTIARRNALRECQPDTVENLRQMTSMPREHYICFSTTPQLNDGASYGNGVIAMFREHGMFHATAWQPLIENPFWDATLVNLGVHYDNYRGNNLTEQYQDDVNTLLHLVRKSRAASRPRFFGFVGSTPQHFDTLDGTFAGKSAKCLNKDECSCVVHKDGKANRWRNDIVESAFETMFRNNSHCPPIFNLETWPIFKDRFDMHPSRTCRYNWISEYNTKGKECSWGHDCTHKCWTPHLWDPIWELLNMAVMQFERCKGPRLGHKGGTLGHNRTGITTRARWRDRAKRNKGTNTQQL